MLLMNSQRLDNSLDEINSNAIVKESVLSWYSFSLTNPTTNRISLQRFAYGLQERNSVTVQDYGLDKTSEITNEDVTKFDKLEWWSYMKDDLHS